MNFKEKVLKIVSCIPEGRFFSYQKIAEMAGGKRASRAVGNILANNKNKNIPCHRVIKSNNFVGKYFGKESLSYLKLALLLKEGVIGVIPTDTIYGICTSALKENSVKEIYKLRKRNPQKPMIILISKIEDLNIFGAKPTKKEIEFLNKIWPGRVSVVFKIKDKSKKEKFKYLMGKGDSLAFRVPQNNLLRKILNISGPLVAPSANYEGKEPAKNIQEAKRYFKDRVVYFDKGTLKGKPSTLIFFEKGKVKILREGADFKKVLRLI
jgi:L-threonylcarbamoyladenylate synthase